MASISVLFANTENQHFNEEAAFHEAVFAKHKMTLHRAQNKWLHNVVSYLLSIDVCGSKQNKLHMRKP